MANFAPKNGQKMSKNPKKILDAKIAALRAVFSSLGQSCISHIAIHLFAPARDFLHIIYEWMGMLLPSLPRNRQPR